MRSDVGAFSSTSRDTRNLRRGRSNSSSMPLRRRSSPCSSYRHACGRPVVVAAAGTVVAAGIPSTSTVSTIFRMIESAALYIQAHVLFHCLGFPSDLIVAKKVAAGRSKESGAEEVTWLNVPVVLAGSHSLVLAEAHIDLVEVRSSYIKQY